MDKLIHNYFKRGEAQGFSKEYVKDTLLRKGYDKVRVQMIYNSLLGTPPQKDGSFYNLESAANEEQFHSIPKSKKTVTFFVGISLFFLSSIISVNIFHNTNLIIFLKWFSLFVPVLAIIGIFWAIIRAYEEIGWYSFLSNILHNFAQLTLLLMFMLIGFRNMAIIFSYNLSYLIVLVFSFFVCKYKFPEIFKRDKLDKPTRIKVNKKLLSYSWPTMFLGAAILLFSWTDSLLIGIFKKSAINSKISSGR